MPCKFSIRLNPAFRGSTEPTISPEGEEVAATPWMDCLRAAATEIQALNTVFVANGFAPIPVNPDSTQYETFLGEGNTIPTEAEDFRYAGIVTVLLKEYDFLDLSLMPAVPSTFFFIMGEPPQAGKFI